MTSTVVIIAMFLGATTPVQVLVAPGTRCIDAASVEKKLQTRGLVLGSAADRLAVRIDGSDDLRVNATRDGRRLARTIPLQGADCAAAERVLVALIEAWAKQAVRVPDPSAKASARSTTAASASLETSGTEALDAGVKRVATENPKESAGSATTVRAAASDDHATERGSETHSSTDRSENPSRALSTKKNRARDDPSREHRAETNGPAATAPVIKTNDDSREKSSSELLAKTSGNPASVSAPATRDDPTNGPSATAPATETNDSRAKSSSELLGKMNGETAAASGPATRDDPTASPPRALRTETNGPPATTPATETNESRAKSSRELLATAAGPATRGDPTAPPSRALRTETNGPSATAPVIKTNDDSREKSSSELLAKTSGDPAAASGPATRDDSTNGPSATAPTTETNDSRAKSSSELLAKVNGDPAAASGPATRDGLPGQPPQALRTQTNGPSATAPANETNADSRAKPWSELLATAAGPATRNNPTAPPPQALRTQTNGPSATAPATETNDDSRAKSSIELPATAPGPATRDDPTAPPSRALRGGTSGRSATAPAIKANDESRAKSSSELLAKMNGDPTAAPRPATRDDLPGQPSRDLRTDATSSAAPTDVSPPTHNWSLDVSAAGGLSTDTSASAVAGLAALGIGAKWTRFGLLLEGGVESNRAATSNELTASASVQWLSLSATVSFHPLERLRLEVAVGARGFRVAGWATPVDVKTDQTLLLAGASASLGISWRLWGPISVQARPYVAVRGAPVQFTVEPVGAVLTLPPWNFGLLLGASAHFELL